MVNERKEDIELALTNFGQFVNKCRKAQGMSLERLGEKTNLSTAYIYRMEKNFRGCTLDNKANILLNGFNWNLGDVLIYLEKVITQKEELKRIVD